MKLMSKQGQRSLVLLPEMLMILECSHAKPMKQTVEARVDLAIQSGLRMEPSGYLGVRDVINLMPEASEMTGILYKS